MKIRHIVLWIAAFVFTLSVARHQRATGPTYPISGKSSVGGTEFKYVIERTHGGAGDHPVVLNIDDDLVGGTVHWRRYQFDEPFHTIPMAREAGILIAYLPHQPPAGKLEYKIFVEKGNDRVVLPMDKTAVIRYKGDVPLAVLIPHVLMMFFGLFFSVRVFLGALFGDNIRRLAWITLGCIVVGGFILGPFVQKYAFDAYWTGWPFGEDLTDNKTAAMFLAWVVAVWRIHRPDPYKRTRWWILASMIVVFTVYLIPHSMRGSQINYNTLSADSLKATIRHYTPDTTQPAQDTTLTRTGQ